MTRGGARANSGRVPEPDAIRRDRPADQAGWVTLPMKREAPAPAWPLEEWSARELALWEHEWTRPQAVMWEANGQQLEVAMYVRTLRAAEKTDASVPTRTLLKQQQETLGLSLPGLARNRWRIASADTAPTKEATHSDRRRPSAKDRLRLIQGEAAAS